MGLEVRPRRGAGTGLCRESLSKLSCASRVGGEDQTQREEGVSGGQTHPGGGGEGGEPQGRGGPT